MPAVPAGRVVGIGNATADLIGVVPRTQESVVELAQFSLQGGGACATALCTAAALGGKASWFGRLSDDEFGRFVHQNFQSFGVDVSNVLLEKGKVSPLSIISIDEQTRRRGIHFTRGNLTPLGPTDLPRSLLADAAVLLIDGREPPVQVLAAEAARERGATVVLDAGHLYKGIGELLALCDVVIASERFATEVAPSGELPDSLMELTKMGPRMAVVTIGDEGAIGLEGEKLVQQDAIDVQVVDTTGAGDVFRGAFVYALAQGWTLERCMPFANAAAGLKCRSLGGQNGIPALREVLATAGLR